MLLLVCLVARAQAGTPEGYAAYLQGDYDAAMREFRPLAERGDPAAQVAVGWLYDNGLGVAHDDGQAARWYTLAAEQGCAMPQQYLGLMYAQGEGVPKDFATAAKWFRLAADQGDPGGAFGLGVIYRDGDGVPANPLEAYKWFSVAVARGTPSLQVQQAIAARSAVAEKLSREQLSTADELARAWKPPRLPTKAQQQRCSFGAAQ